ncbi:FG-GAP-like repeat-containing protein [Streptomyces sp. CBMA29]|uniref:FG-GAP-like repeat-containing protein n=1 Tax=Streptomyces sp. CBMA29 TaxID=1896314 RepID=UPI001661D153|nr:FG-GAP-like repeat-containing protein [Streptomyces sp. CBMA29]
MRITFRAALLTAAAVLGLIAATVTPAQAATGFDRCPKGRFCLFDASDGRGSMAVYTQPQATLGSWDNKASSVYNRTGYHYFCMYSLDKYRYADPVHDVVVYGYNRGDYSLNLSQFSDANSHMDKNLSSFRWAPTGRQCEGQPEPVNWSSDYGPFSRPAQPFGDLDRDGNADLLLRTYSGKLWRLPGDRTGRLVGGGWNSMTALTRHGDLNGDGTEDLLARDKAGELWMYPGTGRGGFGARRAVGPGWNSMTSISAVGDLNGDGKGDLLARDTTGKLWMYPGRGNGAFGTRKLVGPGWNSMLGLVGPGDLTGDGRPDFVASDTSGRLWLYPGNGKGALGTRKMIGTGGWNAFPTLIGAGDFTGDGRPDLIATSSGPHSAQIRLYSGRSGGALTDQGSQNRKDEGDSLF